MQIEPSILLELYICERYIFFHRETCLINIIVIYRKSKSNAVTYLSIKDSFKLIIF